MEVEARHERRSLGSEKRPPVLRHAVGRSKYNRRAPGGIRLCGTFRWLANVDGLKNYLYTAGVLFKDFKAYALRATEEIRQATARTAEEAGRPVTYLASSATRKEDLAREIAERDGEASFSSTASATEICGRCCSERARRRRRNLAARLRRSHAGSGYYGHTD